MPLGITILQLSAPYSLTLTLNTQKLISIKIVLKSCINAKGITSKILFETVNMMNYF